jgi:lipoate-protein ligase A
VYHREDWTFALVIPRGHPLEELRATQSYRVTHEALAEALRAQGVDAITKQIVDDTDEAGVGVCFQRAEVFDVVHASTGRKIAGAAQKRNKHGLLFQGSIWKPASAMGGVVDWDRFGDDFATQLATAFGGAAENVPWPELNDDEMSGLTEQYSSLEWIEYR